MIIKEHQTEANREHTRKVFCEIVKKKKTRSNAGRTAISFVDCIIKNRKYVLPPHFWTTATIWARIAQNVKKPSFSVNVIDFEFFVFNVSIWVPWSPLESPWSQKVMIHLLNHSDSQDMWR